MGTCRAGAQPISRPVVCFFVRSAEDEQLMRKLDELKRDPEKWREYIESRAEKAIKNWRKR